MKCPECGAENTDDADWCSRCQHPFEKTRAAASAGEAGGEAGGNPGTQQVPARPQANWSTGQVSTPQTEFTWPASEYAVDIWAQLEEEQRKVGHTAWRFILLGAAIFFVAAALPSVVLTLVNPDESVVTNLVWYPLDIGFSVFVGAFALLGRGRRWTTARCLIVMSVVVAMLVYRYLTFTQAGVGYEPGVVQSIRLGPSWYVAVLGLGAIGAAFWDAARGRL